MSKAFLVNILVGILVGSIQERMGVGAGGVGGRGQETLLYVPDTCKHPSQPRRAP